MAAQYNIFLSALVPLYVFEACVCERGGVKCFFSVGNFFAQSAEKLDFLVWNRHGTGKIWVWNRQV